MPVQEFALDAVGNSIQVFFSDEPENVTVLLNRSIIGVIPSREELRAGRAFALPDGSTLRVQLVETQLQVFRDGQRLSQNPYGSAAPPQQGPTSAFPNQPPSLPARSPSSRMSLRAWIIVGIVIVSFAISWVALQDTTNNSPASLVVQHYYDAIKGQDYVTAYSYVDPRIHLIYRWDQSITQQSFVQAAQAIDRTEGVVTDYSIREVTIDRYGSNATVIVTVTRHNRSYDVQLLVTEESNGWKIVDFDTF